jgi:hypothetical protein
MPAEKLLFIDTNIWLDFYRARNDTGLKLLKQVEALTDNLIVTYQLESEFKRNRQAVLMESWDNLKPPTDLGFPNIVAEAKASKMLAAHMKEAKKRVARVRSLIAKAMTTPRHDPVYQACERIFHRESQLVLSRENRHRKVIRTKALRRFLQGYPPRKKNDTSMGDGFNWEWMIYCAAERKAELVIVSRDADYGVTLETKCHLNDHLRQEFKERVSSKRKVVLFNRLTDGLKYFKVPVSKKAVDAESAWIRAEFSGSTVEDLNEWIGQATRVAFTRRGPGRKRPSGPLLLAPPEDPAEEEPPTP